MPETKEALGEEKNLFISLSLLQEGLQNSSIKSRIIQIEIQSSNQ